MIIEIGNFKNYMELMNLSCLVLRLSFLFNWGRIFVLILKDKVVVIKVK